jgi:hypothetical protein
MPLCPLIPCFYGHVLYIRYTLQPQPVALASALASILLLITQTCRQEMQLKGTLDNRFLTFSFAARGTEKLSLSEGFLCELDAILAFPVLEVLKRLRAHRGAYSP